MPELLSTAVRGSIARHAQSEAFVSTDERVGYAEFGRRIGHMAARLQRCGIARGDRVAVALPNGADAAAAIYGAWRLGAVAVPLNLQGRARDFTAWLGHCEPRALLAAAGNQELLGAAAACGPALQTLLPADWAESAAEPAADPGDRHSADDVAAIVYTSGTTGSPKGVMLTHANLAANAASVVRYLQLQAADSVLSTLPFYYAYGASVLHTHLAVGARLVLEPNMVFPHALVETLARERVTGFSGVAASFSLLLSRVDVARHDLGALRYLTQAGGPMSRTLTERVRAALPRARLYRMYGQTEATSRLTWLPPESLAERPESVGIAIDGVQLDIREPAGSSLPAGVEGEICARGPNIMRGYWRDAAATARVLRDGWLHTGDRGHLDAAGYLYVAGRMDDLFKTGAHRVNPADIEAVIATQPGVAEVAVVGVPDELLGCAVKAVVVPDGHPALAERDVQRWCRERLAPYLVPKSVEFRDSLPRTGSGKVRRSELAGSIEVQ